MTVPTTLGSIATLLASLIPAQLSSSAVPADPPGVIAEAQPIDDPAAVKKLLEAGLTTGGNRPATVVAVGDTLRINDGCNSGYAGALRIHPDGAVTHGGMLTTKMACLGVDTAPFHRAFASPFTAATRGNIYLIQHGTDTLVMRPLRGGGGG